MVKKLGELAEIHVGQSIRDKIENVEDGEFFIVQMKDVVRGQGVNESSLYRTNIKGKPRLVKKDNLLFVPRVFRESLPYSVLVTTEIDNLIAAPAFYIITADEHFIRAEYLNWFINSEVHGGKFFRKNALGSSILNIPKNVLLEMEIIVPTISSQDQFIKIINAAKREQELMEELIAKRNSFLNEVINNFQEKI
jgi:restriction endonuclease S subunit